MKRLFQLLTLLVLSVVLALPVMADVAPDPISGGGSSVLFLVLAIVVVAAVVLFVVIKKRK